MALKPENPVVAGTVLRRAAIQSPNFVTGVSGWQIKQDGSAEFNNLTLRGTFHGTDFVINADGIFFYSPSEGPGNLVASITTGAGTDSFGNAYQAGFADYSGGSFIQLWNSGGNPLIILSPTGVVTEGNIAALPNGTGFEIAINTPKGAGDIGASILMFSKNASGGANSLVQVPVAQLQAQAGAVVTGGLTADIENVSSGQAVGLVLDITNTTAAPSNVTARINSAQAGDRAFGLHVAGEGNVRLRMDSDGTIHWGPGASGVDTQLYRVSAGLLAADNIAANVAGSAETWHAMTLQNGWTNNTPAAKYRLISSPPSSVELIGDITAGTITDGTQITAALPVAYRPVNAQSLELICIGTSSSPTNTPRAILGAGGALTVFGIPVGTTSVRFHALISLDA